MSCTGYSPCVTCHGLRGFVGRGAPGRLFSHRANPFILLCTNNSTLLLSLFVNSLRAITQSFHNRSSSQLYFPTEVL